MRLPVAFSTGYPPERKKTMDRIRVLVVDGSALMAAVIKDLFLEVGAILTQGSRWQVPPTHLQRKRWTLFASMSILPIKPAFPSRMSLALAVFRSSM